jgi:S1-C subfamily serine protease
MNENDPQAQNSDEPMIAAAQPAPAEPDPAQPAAAQPVFTDGTPVWGEPQPVMTPRRRNRGLLIGGAVAAALGIGAAGVGLGTGLSALREAAGSNSQTLPGQFGQGQSGQGQYGQGQYGQNGSGSGGQYGTFGGRRTFGTSALNATAATAAQKVGVVTIVSTLNYDSSSEAAGSGVILTSGGRILTNNHVIEGSTSIKVTVESTGVSYTAKVIGTDSVDDIAVLQLVDGSGKNVSGLTTAKLDTQKLSVGDTVTSIGNAEGTGNLVAASGSVTALDQAIQVADDSTGATENLSGLIETNADVVSGDSGGPLIDAQGEVTGIVTAASSGSRDVTGYAIPINTAMSIAKKIIAGEAGGHIIIGLPAFLGVELSPTQSGSGVAISGVVDGSAAAGTGLAAGDVITAIDGAPVTTTDSLSSLVKSHAVGDKVTVTYTDASGAAQQLTVTLTAGPAA